ncbi:MAG TPA: PilZ domain-containing protein, partial [Myxococcota bacterium]|nr:PilZ domain-containing protein [Myxococcota bacterium]
MKANGRRYRRYQICIPVELLIGKDKLSLETADVGMSGVFVRTDARPKDGEFVRLGIDLPFDGGALELLGRITSVRRSSDPKRPSGVGVAFYGNGPNERDAWHRFVREI